MYRIRGEGAGLARVPDHPADQLDEEKKRRQLWTRRASDCNAGPESLIQSQSKDWPVQKVLRPGIPPPRLSHGLELPGRAGLCRRAGADPEGAAAGGWQLPVLLATEWHWCFYTNRSCRPLRVPQRWSMSAVKSLGVKTVW